MSMGSVIWLLYLADVVGSVSALLSVARVLTIVGCGGYLFIAAMMNDCADKKLPLMSATRPYLIGAAISLAVACLLPSKETIYAAAAVSAGEKALNTPTGDRAVRALNAWLDRRIADEGSKKN
jgi:hypothetical protein